MWNVKWVERDENTIISWKGVIIYEIAKIGEIEDIT